MIQALRTAPAALVLIVAFIVFSPVSAAEKEVIRSFDSLVEVRTDGTLRVRETIRVVANREKIRHGIYREIPLQNGLDSATFTLLSVQASDGASDKYSIHRSPNRVEVRIGEQWLTIPPGEYTYTIEYETSGHVRSIEGHAELGWNVTGDGWDFVIENASCRVVLPKGENIEEVASWLGKKGSTNSPILISRPAIHEAYFSAKKSIQPGEHFTVAVRFPGRLVSAQRSLSGLRTGIILFLTFAFFFFSWWRWGKDRKPGTIIPLFEPPTYGFFWGKKYGRSNYYNAGTRQPLSAAAEAYIKKACLLDVRAFSSLFVSLAARGLCTISRRRKSSPESSRSSTEQEHKDESKYEFVLTLTQPKDSEFPLLPKEEELVLRAIRSAVEDDGTFVVSEKNQACILQTHDKIVDLFGRRYAPLWIENLWIQAVGWLVIVPAAILAVNNTDNIASSLLPAALLALIIYLIRRQIAHSLAKTINSTSLFKTVTFAIAILVIIMSRLRLFSLLISGATLLYYQITSLTLATIAIIAIPFIFCPVMNAPSRACRTLMDKIDGLLLYINTAEKDQLRAMNPPEETPDTFAKLLPYAVAFGLEDTWCARFVGRLTNAATTINAHSENIDLDDLRIFFRSRRSSSLFNSFHSSAIYEAPLDVNSSGGGGSFFGGGGGGGAGFGGGGGGW